MLLSSSASWTRCRMCWQSIRNLYVYFLNFPFDALVPADLFIQNLVYTGTRGGTIVRWDTRTRSHNQIPLFSNRYRSSSITHLRTIGKDRLLVGSMDGRLELFDLRFPLESTPVTSFPGHVNSYTQRLVSQCSETGQRPLLNAVLRPFQ